MKKPIAAIKTLIFFLLIAGFTVVLYLKNNVIEALREEVRLLPKIEYINTTDTIKDSIIYYTDILRPSEHDTEFVEVIKYVEKNLTKDDSLQIGKKVIGWITDYNTVKLYDHVFKDDSSAFVKLIGSIYRNDIKSMDVVFKNRYPYYREVVAPNKTEIYAGFGAYTKGLLLNAGVMTKGRVFYQIQADPINSYYGAQISFKLFQIK